MLGLLDSFANPSDGVTNLDRERLSATVAVLRRVAVFVVVVSLVGGILTLAIGTPRAFGAVSFTHHSLPVSVGRRAAMMASAMRKQ